MNFKVHYELDGVKYSKIIAASDPNTAARTVRQNIPGAIVKKTKVDRS